VKKLRNVIAAALLLLPVLALNAGTLSTAKAPAGLNPTQPVAGWCYIYQGGRWWMIPC